MAWLLTLPLGHICEPHQGAEGKGLASSDEDLVWSWSASCGPSWWSRCSSLVIAKDVFWFSAESVVLWVLVAPYRLNCHQYKKECRLDAPTSIVWSTRFIFQQMVTQQICTVLLYYYYYYYYWFPNASNKKRVLPRFAGASEVYSSRMAQCIPGIEVAVPRQAGPGASSIKQPWIRWT